MLYLDMNTGDSAQAPRDQVRDDVVESLRVVTMQGGPILGRQGFTVDVERVAGGGAMYAISCGHAAMATCGLAWTKGGARMLWPRLEAKYGQIFSSELPADQPTETPWLGVISHPPVVYGHSCKEWLGDFQRSFIFNFQI